MTPEERADTVEIPMIDVGDKHCSRWELKDDEARKNIANAIRAAVAEEREACAKVAGEFNDFDEYDPPAPSFLTERIAAAIRARSQS